MSRRFRTWGLVGAGVGASVWLTAGVLTARRDAQAPVVTAEAITRGAVVRTISAMGTLEAVTTVEVGSQVSGSIQALHADFNSIVKKGQVLARLDPSLYQSAIEQARANLVRAEAEVERLQVGLADAQVKHARAVELSGRQLIPATELDAAAVNVRLLEAQVRSAAAQVAQAAASLRQAEVNLSKTVITSPIDGIVIARNVDVGQTVAASLSAPTLFVLAADLETMQLKASIDESDLGAIEAGQPVTFTVDAYPGETFAGAVQQVRLNPVVEQNVVTYAAVINAPNPRLALKPGLTAHVRVEVARGDGVLRVPAAALRFRPSDDVKKALGADGLVPTGTVVWQQTDGGLRPVPVTAGTSDGMFTEITGELEEGTRVVTRVALGGESRPSTAGSTSPLLPAGGSPRR